MPSDLALRAIRSWYRMNRATEAFSADVRRRYLLTGEQLALLRIVAERDQWLLGDLRKRLTMHPATLGQAVERLSQRGLLTVDADQADRRRRAIAVSSPGHTLLGSIPLVGPVRLRTVPVEPERLERLVVAFDDAVELFGLSEWAP